MPHKGLRKFQNGGIVRPGKFEGTPDQDLGERLYDSSLEGGTDDQVGSVGDLGWYGLFTDFEGRHFIVNEDENGFFGYEEFDSAEDANRTFAQIEDQYDSWYAGSEDVEMAEGAVVEDAPGVEAIVGEAGPEAVIPLDDPEAVEVMADAIEEGGAGETNANDATVAAAEAVESAAEAVEVVAVADAVEEVAEAEADAVEAQAEAVEEVAEAEADATESAAEAVEEVSEDAAEAVEESPDQAPEIAHKWFAPLSGKRA